MAYESADGTRASGAAALAHVFEHLNLGWALAGWGLALPGVRHGVQLCADAFGAGPRALPRAPHPVAAAADAGGKWVIRHRR